MSTETFQVIPLSAENPLTAVGGTTVGLVGIGHMGLALGHSLLRSGYRVLGYDIRPEAGQRLADAGGTRAASITAVAAHSDVICFVVVNDEQLRAAVQDALGQARPRTILAVHSTVLPSTVIELAELATGAEAQLVDATLTGGAERGELGELTVMVGGPEAPVRRCWPVFEAIGSHVFHVGPVGAGAAMKAVNNLMSIGTYALALEGMSIAGAFGISEDAVTEVLCTGAADSRVLRTWGRSDRTRADPSAGLGHAYDVAKDLRVAATAGGSRGLVLPLTSVTAAIHVEQVRRRDAELAANPRPTVPRCSACNQELAAPFRAARVHPECVRAAPSS